MLDERPQITIRAAEESDVEFAHSLSKKAFSQYGPYEDMLERWFQSGTTETLLALMEKRPVGSPLTRSLGCRVLMVCL